MKKKTVSQQKKALDSVFSRFIRYRDALITTGTLTRSKCCTCDYVGDIKHMDCGHWMSRGHGGTRYDEHNCHCTCKACNGPKGGMQEDHRRYIVEAYGEKEMERIYHDAKQTKRWTTEELQELLNYYKEEVKLMEKEYA